MEELSLNILDIAQNSVRANATRVDITVAELPAEDRLVITITDNGCGMTPEQVAHVEDPFYTTRTTRKVGLGVPFFKMAALMTGGDFSICSQPGEGTEVRAVFGLTHIDRMPLGNMADTMCILMGCNEQINFSFTYRVGGKGLYRQHGAAAGDFGRRSPEYPPGDGFYPGVHQRKYGFA